MTTYRSRGAQAAEVQRGITGGEATPGRLNAVIRSMRAAHGANMARHARTLLRGGLQIAVLDDVLAANPVAQVSRIESDRKPKGAPSLGCSAAARPAGPYAGIGGVPAADLVDPIIMFIATGLRRSELFALRWEDFDETAGTITVCGKIARIQV